MTRFLASIYFLVVGLAAALSAAGQVTISGQLTVASGASSCYSVTTTCTIKTFCWSGSGLTSITPETSCGGGGGTQSLKSMSAVPLTGGGGNSCTDPGMANIVFPTVTTTTTAYIYVQNYCSIQGQLAVTILPPPSTLT